MSADDAFEMVQPPSEMRVAVKMIAEKEAVSWKTTDEQHVLATISVVESEESDRTPLEVVAVVDRSGSMAGKKLDMVQKTLCFLAKTGLRKTDTFAIVTFHSDYNLVLPKTAMDENGSAKALDAIAEIQPGAATNLSGGLLHGIREMDSTAAVPGTARAILLFTDGQPNGGLTTAPEIREAVQGTMVDKQTKIHTFGFGSDCQVDILQDLASNYGGSYNFVRDVEAIPVAFGNALGSLVSMQAQAATLSLSWGSEVASIKVLGDHTKKVDPDSKTIEVNVGDLYSQLDKNILMQVKLKELPAKQENVEPMLFASVKYYDMTEKMTVTATGNLKIARPDETPEQAVNLTIDAQKNRIAVADAIKAAKAAGDRGDVAEGRTILLGAAAAARRTASGNTSMVQALVHDVDALNRNFESVPQYRSLGAPASSEAAAAWGGEVPTPSFACPLTSDSQAEYQALAASAVKDGSSPASDDEAPQPRVAPAPHYRSLGAEADPEVISPPAAKRAALSP